MRANLARGVILALVAITLLLPAWGVSHTTGPAQLPPSPTTAGHPPLHLGRATPFPNAILPVRPASNPIGPRLSPGSLRGGLPTPFPAAGGEAVRADGSGNRGGPLPASPLPSSLPPAWTNITPFLGNASPSPRWSAMEAFDPLDGYVVMFGGYGTGLDGDTWAFSGGAWTNLSPVTSPPPRYDAVMAWDAADGYVVLFGGYGVIATQQVVLNDTWTFVHGVWSNITHLSAGPSPRASTVMDYDPVDRELVLFGGADLNYTALNDTWTFANGTWTNRTSAVAGSPAGRYTATGVWDVADGYFVVFGGCTVAACPNADTWTFANLTWKHLTPVTRPGVRGIAAMTYDPVAQKVVLFGGVDASFNSLADTWTFHGGTWSAITATAHPGGRGYAALAWDAADGFGVVLDGATVSVQYNDTWTLGPTLVGWLRVAPAVVDLGQSVELNATPAGHSGFLSFNWTQLPSGCVGANASVLGCTPNATGPAPVSVVLNDSSGVPRVENASVTVHPDPTIVRFVVSPASVTLGSPVFVNVTLDGGGTAPFGYAYAGLPAGCGTRDLATFACTPLRTGPFAITASVVDGAGWAINASTQLTVNPRPSLLGFSAAPGVLDLGSRATFFANATGGTAPLTYTYTGLPAGCVSANISVLACSPLDPGTSTVHVAVHDLLGWNATATATLVVNPTLVLAAFDVSAASVDVGQVVRFWVNASGGTAPITYGFSGLPAGCTLGNASTGTCAANTSGTYRVNATIRDGAGGTAGASLTFTVNPPLLLASVALSPPAIDVGLPTTITPSFHGGTEPYAFAYGGLPGGCTSASLPALVCRPAVAGQPTIVVTVRDRWGATSQLGAELVVNPRLQVSSFAATPTPSYVGSSITFAVGLEGGSGGYDVSFPQLPPGCTSANTSSLTCTPSEAGTFRAEASVTDTVGGSANASLNLTVLAAGGGSPSGSSGGTLVVEIAGGALAVAAVAAAVVVARRRRRSPRAPAEPTPPTP